MDEKLEVEQILKACMDSPGYVIFVGYLAGDKKDTLLQIRYRRYHVCKEDLQAYINVFADHAGSDLERLRKEDAESGKS